MKNKNNFHIAILCSRLDLPGGIERAVVNTANLFTEKNNNVSLIILDHTAESFYPINPSINIIQLPLSFGITQDGNIISRKLSMLSDVLQLRKSLKNLKPDLVIATEYPFAASAILSGLRNKIKIVSWEHHHIHELGKNKFWDKISKYTYPKLHGIICLNEDEKNLFNSFNYNAIVVPNFVNPTAITTSSHVENKTILTVARLVHVKGIDLLISVAKKLFQKHPDWKWKVVGNSENDDMIKSLIAQENLADNLIIQAPVSHHITEEYNNASIYVMTSRNECFPMTLLEAQSNGLPCVAFDCETGPRHIINNKEDGFLIEKENTEKMMEAISSLINDEGKRKKMGAAASENIQRFSADAVYEIWKKKVLFD